MDCLLTRGPNPGLFGSYYRYRYTACRSTMILWFFFHLPSVSQQCSLARCPPIPFPFPARLTPITTTHRFPTLQRCVRVAASPICCRTVVSFGLNPISLLHLTRSNLYPLCRFRPFQYPDISLPKYLRLHRIAIYPIRLRSVSVWLPVLFATAEQSSASV